MGRIEIRVVAAIPRESSTDLVVAIAVAPGQPPTWPEFGLETFLGPLVTTDEDGIAELYCTSIDSDERVDTQCISMGRSSNEGVAVRRVELTTPLVVKVQIGGRSFHHRIESSTAIVIE